ncbi:hypothetical protein KW797_00050 [Candidatus Parcubacteria bacterium]|nr:hypothetical protein [Candidatus Parcubacteria bacterium]
MRNLVYAGIRRKATDPLAGLSATFVNQYIAKWDCFFVDYARWNLPTFKKQKVVNYYSGTSIYSALTTSALYAELTDNTYAASGGGRISVNGDLIDYSAKDTPTSGKSVTISTATGALTADIAHVAGERVEFLVPVPSDFGKPGEMWFMNAGSKASSKLSHKDWRDSPIPIGRFYTFHDGYLILPQNLSTQNFQLHYWKKGLKAVASDSLQCPEQMDDVVKYGAMAECYLITKEFDMAAKMFKLAGLPNPLDPGADMNGLLQYYAGLNAEQTNSGDEVFIPELGSLHM